MANKIFISYRREDSAATAGRLHDRLAETFGRANLFIDVDNLPAGVDFAKYLNEQVANCDIFLCTVGPNWLNAKDDDGRRRLDQADDFVRVEIAAALNRDIPVIPVLVDGARLPRGGELPDDIAPLIRRQYVEVRNSHFGRDADALTQEIRKILKEKRSALSPVLLTTIGTVALLMFGSIGTYYLARKVSWPWIYSGTPSSSSKELPRQEASKSLPPKQIPISASLPEPKQGPTSPQQTVAGGASHPDLVTDCDWLAASPTDLQRPKAVQGVILDQIDVARALAACNEAVSKYPDVGRFSYQLGRAYLEAKNDSEAYKQFGRAVSLGSTAALNGVGSLYMNGLGVPRDYAEAQRWFEKGAAAGEPTAMYNIGALYRDGKGVPQDYAEARRWFEKAAAAGEPTAMEHIGRLYRDAKGVPQDYAEARRWFEKAAAAGDASAMNNIGILYYNGNGVPQDNAEARRWYEKAAAAGDRLAMENLGYQYRDGKGVPQDYAEARRWFEKAAAAGLTDAMVRLGDMYSNGQGGAASATDARTWYEKAAAAGDAVAKDRIAALTSPARGAADGSHR
jgi:uncharacterized protein